MIKIQSNLFLMSGVLYLLCFIIACFPETQELSLNSSIDPQKINLNEKRSAIYEGGVELVLELDSKARYLVKEQLAGLDFPNDAIGETPEITGTIYFEKDGHIIAENSRIKIDMRSLKSDKKRRDRYLSGRSLETNKYPTAVIIITEINGLSWPFPDNGSHNFTINGETTIHGITKPTSWEAVGVFTEESVSGTARTSFKFEKFEIDVPRVAIVLSVENNIRLELEFVARITSD